MEETAFHFVPQSCHSRTRQLALSTRKVSVGTWPWTCSVKGWGCAVEAKTCALYLRVSTDGQTVHNQRLELERYAGCQQWQIVRVFEDSATGSNGDRPGFKAMFDAASRHEFDVVLVWACDR